MKKKISYEEFARMANYKYRQKEEQIEKECFNTERLCKTMNENGVDIATVIARMYDNGIANSEEKFLDVINGKMPSVIELRVICQTVNVSADYLLNLSDRVN